MVRFLLVGGPYDGREISTVHDLLVHGPVAWSDGGLPTGSGYRCDDSRDGVLRWDPETTGPLEHHPPDGASAN